jgi:hypothetical protein
MMVGAGVPPIAVVDDGIGVDAKSSRGRGLLGMEEGLLVGVRNSVCGVSKSRPMSSDHDKEIAKLKRELREIDLAIADFERLEANSSSKGKGIKTPKSGNLIQMKRRPGKR